jgi:hypothetical protein
MTEHVHELDAGRTITLDATTLCSISGCRWTVRLGAGRCAEHGGVPEDTLYITSDTGETTYFLTENPPDDGDTTV